jgi:hypothetical protein
VTLDDSTDTLAKLRRLLQQTYELKDYTVSKFDSAPIALASGHDPRHAEKDQRFRERRDELMSGIKILLDSNWDSLEHHRFKLRLERRTPGVPYDKNPVWKGVIRCRCWWDMYDELAETANYLEDLLSDLESQRRTSVPSTRGVAVDGLGKAEATPSSQPEIYVEPDRIDELRAITSHKYDLTRLIELCEELNKCYANECFLAVAMLTRTVLNHVPPIFEFGTFSEVANNYGDGGKSFKEQMQRLEESLRTIADRHLHARIRKKEALPNRTQVDFSNDVDVLLEEVVRVLK